VHPELSPEFATELLAEASALDNKYSRGVVGFVTGSENYPGAALLGLEAAYELEIGMACYQGPKVVSDLVMLKRPETVLGIEKSNVLVVGSGIADDEAGDQLINLRRSLKLGLPMVIDAGALAILDVRTLEVPSVITPHYGEAERLFKRLGHPRAKRDIAGNPTGSAFELAELTGSVVLLKGSISIIALKGFPPIESGPGSVHLATAGTGDVLAGMIGALAAKFIAKNRQINHENLRDVVLLANQIHSEAAELAAEKGEFGASAVAAAISSVLTQ
jgi:ADP-dependent NAD(P)H-hydrate dehydratase / NAD(P)H-hydrate epimerase